MAQTKRATVARNTAANRRHRTNGSGNLYVYDSTARDWNVRRQLEEEPRKRLSHAARKNRDKATHMDIGYVAFLVVALCFFAYVLINYVQLQSDITNKVKSIARLESKLNSEQLANEEEYNRVLSEVDLEEIKKIAIGELGMTYAREGQIITYSRAGHDYMRQVSE